MAVSPHRLGHSADPSGAELNPGLDFRVHVFHKKQGMSTVFSRALVV